MRNVFVRSPYNYDVEAASVESGYSSDEPSMTQQEFTEDADINTIVKRFGVTGQLPQDVRMPMYGDFTEVGDYRSAVEAVMAAEESFMEMPAEVRRRFDNDPQKFLEFCEDPANADEARKLGLVRPLPAVTPASAAEPDKKPG